jgi:hypothetical protein
MTDSKIITNEFDEDKRTPKDLGFTPGVVTDLTQWPAGAESDGRLYRLAWTQNQRAVTTTVGGDVLLGDDEGVPQFVPVDAGDGYELPENLANIIEGKVGTYHSMSKLSVHLNKLQEGPGSMYRAFSFFPDPIEELKAA